MKKCKSCGAPLEGLLFKIGGIFTGLKPSARDPNLCNKCEGKGASASPSATQEEASEV